MGRSARDSETDSTGPAFTSTTDNRRTARNTVSSDRALFDFSDAAGGKAASDPGWDEMGTVSVAPAPSAALNRAYSFSPVSASKRRGADVLM
jgi:hypothetical protein